MSQTVRILLALMAGLLAGMLLARIGGTAQGHAVAVAGPIGTAWLNALQMPLIPLIFGLVVTGISAAARSATTSRIAPRALMLFGLLILGSAILSVILGTALLRIWPAAAANTLAAGGDGPPVDAVMPNGNWLLSFIPPNPIAAAASGQMVAIMMVALLVGFAATRVPPETRDRLLGPIEALVDILLVVIGWILRIAPIGVFALALVAGSRSGVAVAGALLHYVALVVLILVILTALVYPIAIVAGRIGPGRFARAVLAPQAIAFSTQSSIASLPAMIRASDTGLAVRPEVRSVVLPMAVALFRITSPAANLAVVLYIASAHGMTLGPVTLAVGIAVSVLVSVAAVGLPGQVSFFTSIGPICLAMGVPVELLPLLLAVETLPDIFRTIGNVTADLAVTRILDRRAGP